MAAGVFWNGPMTPQPVAVRFAFASLSCLSFFGMVVCLANTAQGQGYDPLQVAAQAAVEPLDLAVTDTKRTREIPLRVFLPAGKEPAPVVLFSHGLGGSREGSPFLGKHWAARGYVAVFLQHPGSDEAVWKGQPVLRRMAALREAASTANFSHRVQDVPAVLDELTAWNDKVGHPLHKRLDLKRVGMSGHSFGAQTTQAVSGQAFELVGTRQTDPRIKAAVIMSPGVPQRGSPERAFGNVKQPWLLMTGTLDDSPIGSQSPESRRKVYPVLPAGDKFELVLNKAEHSVFTERALPGERQQRNPNHHKAILALSTAFWDTYLKEDAAAKAWLTSDQVRKVLEADDLWQAK